MRSAATHVPHTFSSDAQGLRAVNVMAREHAIEPFLVFTEFHMDRQVFGPHPHAGISVLTYLLPDSAAQFRNRDSNGDDSRILPGGLHITQAGRGVHHDEFPLPGGKAAHGFQIWIDHAAEHRFIDPLAMHADPHEIPERQISGATIRVLLGRYDDLPARHPLVTPVTLLHVLLEPGATLSLPGEEMAFTYVVAGGGESGGVQLTPQSLTTYRPAVAPVGITAGAAGLSLLFATGTPRRAPLVYGGPFVMSTPQQMADTRARYARGEMGTLAPIRG